MPNMRRREKVFGYLAVFSSFVGGCGLILLSIFDTKRFTTLHRLFLLIFILGVGFSAIFTVIEVYTPCLLLYPCLTAAAVSMVEQGLYVCKRTQTRVCGEGDNRDSSDLDRYRIRNNIVPERQRRR